LPIAPNPQAAIRVALSSSNPALQQMGMKLLEQQSERDQKKQQLADTLKAVGITQDGGQGAPTGMNKQALALLLADNQGLNKVGQYMLDNEKPIVMREGNLVKLNPNGSYSTVYEQPGAAKGVVFNRDPSGKVIGASDIPGYGAAAANIEGAAADATAKAKSKYETATLELPGGNKLVSRAALAEQLNPTGSTQTGGLPPVPASVLGGGAPPSRTGAIAPMPSGAPAGAPANLPGIELQTQASQVFNKAAAEKQSDELFNGYKEAKNAAGVIAKFDQLSSSFANPMFSGTGAEAKLAFAKAINGLIPGINLAPEKVANTEAFQAQLADAVIKQMGGSLGAGVSNADRDFLVKAVGTIGTDPAAFSKIAEGISKMYTGAINTHNARVNQAMQGGFKPQFDLRIGIPAPPPRGGVNKGGADEFKNFKLKK